MLTLEEFMEMRLTDCSPIDIDLHENGRYVAALACVGETNPDGEINKYVFDEYRRYQVVAWYIDDFYDPDAVACLNILLEP